MILQEREQNHSALIWTDETIFRVAALGEVPILYNKSTLAARTDLTNIAAFRSSIIGRKLVLALPTSQ